MGFNWVAPCVRKKTFVTTTLEAAAAVAAVGGGCGGEANHLAGDVVVDEVVGAQAQITGATAEGSHPGDPAIHDEIPQHDHTHHHHGALPGSVPAQDVQPTMIADLGSSQAPTNWEALDVE